MLQLGETIFNTARHHILKGLRLLSPESVKRNLIKHLRVASMWRNMNAISFIGNMIQL